MVKRTSLRKTISVLVAVLPALSLCMPAQAMQAQGISADVVAHVWNEDDHQVASVCLNGKEVLSFRGDTSGAAADRAEDVAAKLQELLEDRRFDADYLLPTRAGALAALQVDGNTVLSFDPAGATSEKGSSASAVEAGWRLANGIRTACGSAKLPSAYLKLAQQSGANSPVAFSGHASWYGGKFHGRKCSDGTRYDQEKLTAAHRSLPFGTKLLVMNRKTGNSCVVKVNDRGPFVGDRIIDLSKGAARQLDMLSEGVAVVDCLVLGNE